MQEPSKRRLEEFQEMEKTLKGEKARYKRGLVDAGGKFLRWLFGTASASDLKDLHTRLENMERGNNDVVHLMKEQSPLLNVTVSHLTHHEDAINLLMKEVVSFKQRKQLLRDQWEATIHHVTRKIRFLHQIVHAFGKAERALD